MATDREKLIEVSNELTALQFGFGRAIGETTDLNLERALRRLSEQVRNIATAAYEQAVPRDEEGGR